MDIGYNTGIDKSHRHIFKGGGGWAPPKRFCIPQELFVPHQKYFVLGEDFIVFWIV